MDTSRNTEIPSITNVTQQQPEHTVGTEEKTRKRDFFRLGRKDDDKKKAKATPHTSSSGGLRPVSPLAGLDASRSTGSPSRNHPYGGTSSPRGVRSASPRTHSPASSMIFERSVQEDVAVPQASPQIPSHIITENHIPPALDATSEAITDRKLDPDAVEIITHAAHQPAAVTITEGHHDAPISPVMSEEQIASPMPRTDTDNASSYANLDSVDVRRLSFISFADVVQAEHDLTDGRRDSAAITSHPNIPAPRSPSPMRSPVSSAAQGTSPPTSVSPSMHEASPHRGTSDLNIETMRQALRKTGSGDLSGFRSAPLSPAGNEDARIERTLR
ncbi:hypothetical protein PMZ80_005234 [Knufia obscura]|uniref:Uncharacterized protein n=2 Tax=Knufia TaxID=430999 RepID=A0AAN8F0K3_9EURO|nr:hypothetical protein PMZ80_005234 [Knufia obscura]KAK5957901.1 hypothetical protein OHC33_001090 [Knufia fluminis]